MKTTKEISQKINQYIIDAINCSGYDNLKRSEGERIKFVYETFKREYCYEANLRRYGNETNTFAQWLMGLPSVINIDFENFHILRLSKEWGFIEENATARMEQQILDNWFNRIAIRFFQLLAKASRIPKTYERKTQDIFEIQGYYGNGWECVTTESTYKEAKTQIKCYRENDPNVFRIVKKRMKLATV